MAGLALCSYKDCELKETCKRFCNDKNIMVVKFENILNENGECGWYSEIPPNIVTSDKNVENNKKD